MTKKKGYEAALYVYLVSFSNIVIRDAAHVRMLVINIGTFQNIGILGIPGVLEIRLQELDSAVLLILCFTSSTKRVQQCTNTAVGNPIAGDHSKQDLRYIQKPIYFPIFNNNMWSYLLWSPRSPVTRTSNNMRP